MVCSGNVVLILSNVLLGLHHKIYVSYIGYKWYTSILTSSFNWELSPIENYYRFLLDKSSKTDANYAAGSVFAFEAHGLCVYVAQSLLIFIVFVIFCSSIFHFFTILSLVFLDWWFVYSLNLTVCYPLQITFEYMHFFPWITLTKTVEWTSSIDWHCSKQSMLQTITSGWLVLYWSEIWFIFNLLKYGKYLDKLI